MSRRGSITMTAAQVAAHQQKHFGPSSLQFAPSNEATKRIPRDRMNKTEREFSLRLEAMKRKGEISEWGFEKISLAWGADPRSGKQMWYTPDFWLFDGRSGLHRMIEVKGAHIFRQQAMARFKGCRAEYPMFEFEMWQKKEGVWTRIQ